MTTKPAYQILSVIDYDRLDYDPNEVEPLPDGMEQNPAINRILDIIRAHLLSLYPKDEVFIDTNTTLCYNPDNLNNRVLPDVYFAIDVDASAIRRRKLYLPWEAGKPPDFALEIGSESTFRNDMGHKRDLYARIGISEYWRFDPTGGDYYNQPLIGELLINGSYQRLELTNEPDGVLKGFSPVLGQSLCWTDGIAGLYNPQTRTYHLDSMESRQKAESEQTARQEAQIALQASEARVRLLEEELKRLRDGS